MAERKASPSRKKRTPTPAEIAAGSATLAKVRAATAACCEQAKEEGRESSKQRWSRLLDGSLTVRDLEDEEITKMALRRSDGTFSGSKRAMPSHIAQQFHQEAIRRSNDKLRSAAPEAV